MPHLAKETSGHADQINVHGHVAVAVVMSKRGISEQRLWSVISLAVEKSLHVASLQRQSSDAMLMLRHSIVSLMPSELHRAVPKDA